MKTADEIENLKRQWMADNIWDIENTEGFEAHRAELLAFRLATEAEWAAQRQARLERRATELGCSVALVEYLERLEYQIKQLREMVDDPAVR